MIHLQPPVPLPRGAPRASEADDGAAKASEERHPPGSNRQRLLNTSVSVASVRALLESSFAISDPKSSVLTPMPHDDYAKAVVLAQKPLTISRSTCKGSGAPGALTRKRYASWSVRERAPGR